MSGEHVLCWSSSVKPVMAICLAQLQERGLLCFDDPVAKFLPAFKAQGKGLVTIRHCLTHTAGLWGSMMDRTEKPTDFEVLRHISAQPLAERWTVGARCGYDSPAWYVLAGVVTAADLKHRSFQRYAEEEVFGPLGLDSCSIGPMSGSNLAGRMAPGVD
ncbi:unnamed protein product [Effrenium voratum]|nr:unnamed protein product [Effrenium voratum]